MKLNGQITPSVCIDAVLEGMPLEQALDLVKACGYEAFEFWCWWEKDLEAVKRLSQEKELSVASCCTRFISLTEPSLRDEYIQGVTDSIEAAREIGCSTLISQVGDFIKETDRIAQHQSIVDGLRAVSGLLESANITLVIEPLNEKVDHAGYFLIRSDEAFEIVEKVESPNVKVVFDIYHQQISEGDLIQNIVPNIEKIGHFHAAGNPGRNELTRGEINYPSVFEEIVSAGYAGYVGLEYWPVAEPSHGLKEVAGWF